MFIKIILTCFFLNVVSMAFAQSKGYAPIHTLDTMLNKKAPNFELKSIKGITYNLEKLKDTVVVINFWFKGCVPCMREIPSLNELVSKYKNTHVIFLAISVLGSETSLKNFAKNTTFDYDIIASNFKMAETYSVSAYPSNLIIDKHGKIIYVKVGFSMLNDIVTPMSEAIDKALKEE